MDLFFIFQCIHDDEPGRFCCREREVIFLDLPEYHLLLKMLAGCRFVDSRECCIDREDKEEGVIRGNGPSVMQASQPGDRVGDMSFKGDRLVRITTVRVPIRYDKSPLRKIGPDN